MKIKILIGIVFLLLANNFIYAKIPQEHPSSFCEFPSVEIKNKVIEFLSKSYDAAVNSILNGRNGQKFNKCKIDEIKKILPKLIFEYSCSCGNCGEGGPSHDIIKGTPVIRICDPFDLYVHPTSVLCGCIEGLIVHEIIHAAGDPTEEGAVDCAKILYPCANDPWGNETSDHRNCNCCDK